MVRIKAKAAVAAVGDDYELLLAIERGEVKPKRIPQYEKHVKSFKIAAAAQYKKNCHALANKLEIKLIKRDGQSGGIGGP